MMRHSLDDALRTVLDHATEGVLIEANEHIIYINDTYASSLGYHSPRDLCGATIRDIAAEEDCERLQWFGRCREEGKPAPHRYAFRARRRDGSLILLEASVSATFWRGQLLITTIARESVAASSHSPSIAVPGLRPLSLREYEVLSQLLAGRRAKEIAFNLGISEKTVGTLRSRAYHKLAFRGDLDLFRYAAENGLLEDRERRNIFAPKS